MKRVAEYKSIKAIKYIICNKNIAFNFCIWIVFKLQHARWHKKHFDLFSRLTQSVFQNMEYKYNLMNK